GLLAWLFCPRRERAPKYDWIAAALLAAGLFAKESAIILFPVVATIAATRFRFVEWMRGRRATLTALTGVTVLWGAWRAWIRLSGRDDVPLSLGHRDVGERILRTARYAVRATQDGIIPLRWSPEYAPPAAPSPLWLLPLAGVVGSIWVLSKHRRFRVVAAG